MSTRSIEQFILKCPYIEQDIILPIKTRNLNILDTLLGQFRHETISDFPINSGLKWVIHIAITTLL